MLHSVTYLDRKAVVSVQAASAVVKKHKATLPRASSSREALYRLTSSMLVNH